MKLLVIGCGNMGSAIIQAVLKRETQLFETVTVFDVTPAKCEASKALGAVVLESMEGAQIDGDTFVLVAVKPQYIDPVLEDLKPRLNPGSLLISIAAGVTMARLKEKSAHEVLVRVMPNMPALVGKGASGWIASLGVTQEQKDMVKGMLESFGVAVEVAEENQIDTVTALSGSGPAYMFYILEAMVESSLQLGLSPENALDLAVQTMIGGGALAKANAKTLEEIQTLRANVTSKGGTTEAAIGVFDAKGLKLLIGEAMQAAYQRAQKL